MLKALFGSPWKDGCAAALGLVICLPLSRLINTWDLTGRTAPGYRRCPFTRRACMCTQHERNTPVLTLARKTDQKKCKYAQETPAHRVAEALCARAIFALRPHALMQSFRGDRVQSLQIDWSIFITALDTKTDVSPSFPRLKRVHPYSAPAAFKHPESFVPVFKIYFFGQNSQSQPSFLMVLIISWYELMMWHKLREIMTPLPSFFFFALNVSMQWPSCLVSVVANVSVTKVVLKRWSVWVRGDSEREK